MKNSTVYFKTSAYSNFILDADSEWAHHGQSFDISYVSQIATVQFLCCVRWNNKQDFPSVLRSTTAKAVLLAMNSSTSPVVATQLNSGIIPKVLYWFYT